MNPHAASRVVVLSPHSDDACYSLAGLLRQHALAGRSVQVITVFSETRYVEHSSPPPGTTVAEQRKNEDRRFLALLAEGVPDGTRVEGAWLDYDDAPLREGYLSGEVCISRPLLADDLALASRLAKALGSVVGCDADLLVPLGLGQHVDHLIVREAGMAITSGCNRTFLYEDLPYAAEVSPEHVDSCIESFAVSRTVRLTSSVVEIPGGTEWKLGVVRAYESQHTKGIAAQLAAHARRFSRPGSERVWMMECASTEAETERLRKTAVARGIAITVHRPPSLSGTDPARQSCGVNARYGTSRDPAHEATPDQAPADVPWSIMMIEAVGRCNAACTYCPQGAGLIGTASCEPITSDTLSRALSLARMGRARAMYLHHRGEPFLHPELHGVVRQVREAGFGAYLSTNLIAATPDRIDHVLDAGLSQMEIHLSGGATTLPSDELLFRIHHARKSNWRIRNNGCRIEVNYGLYGETKDDVLQRLERSPYYDETMPIRFYVPHDWPSLANRADCGVDFRKCQWWSEKCCAVLSNGDLVICCLDQFRYSTVANIHDIDRIEDCHLSQRGICQGCLQYDWDMDWLRDDAIGMPSWRIRGDNRSSPVVGDWLAEGPGGENPRQ